MKTRTHIMIIARWCVYRFSKHRSCLNHLRWSMCSEGRWGDRRNGKESLVGGRDRTMEATDAATRVPACRDRQGTNRGKHKMFEAGARLRLNQEQSSEHLMSVVMCRCFVATSCSSYSAHCKRKNNQPSQLWKILRQSRSTLLKALCRLFMQ